MPKFYLALFLATAIAIAAPSCEPAPPELKQPDIRGEVEGLSDSMGDTGIIGFILIAGEQAPDTTYDRAFVAVTGDTRIYKRKEKRLIRAGFDQIGSGSIVEAWFSGPVAESYPVQANAKTILILQ